MVSIVQPKGVESEEYFEPYSGAPLVEQSTNSQPLQLQPPQSGTIYANQDDMFMKWLFDLKTQTIMPLKMAWRGLEWSPEDNKWIPVAKLKDGQNPAIMNEVGINWAASLLESYFNRVFLTTNMSVRNYNFRMRTAARFILNTMHERYKEFELLPSNVERVSEEIESKISALLAGAINDGYRRMFISQIQVHENRMYAPVGPPQGGAQSIFSKGSSSGAGTY